MSQDTGRSDLLSLKRELLDSARLDVQPLPASVRKQALLAVTIAGVASATAGTATAAGTATITSGVLGTSTSVVLGLAKLGGIGALLVSVGTATYYGTEGAWHSPRTSTNGPAPEMRTGRRATSPVKSTHQVASPPVQALDGVPSPSPAIVDGVPSPSARPLDDGPSLGTSELRGIASPPESYRARNHAGSPNAADAKEGRLTLPASPHRNVHSTTDGRDGSRSPAQPTPLESAPTRFPSSEQAQNIQQQAHVTLSKELALLDSARSMLTAGDPGATLSRLDQYARDFASGTLQPEAMFLRVQALSQSGQDSAATQMGRHFLNRYPTSPHAARVRALIESHPDDQNP